MSIDSLKACLNVPRFCVGQHLLVGIPGGYYEGQLILLTGHDMKTDSLFVQDIAYQFHDSFGDFMRKRYACGGDSDYKEIPIRYGGQHEESKVFLILLDDIPHIKPSRTSGFLNIYESEEAFFAAYEGDMREDFLIVAGHQLYDALELEKDIKNGQLGVVPITPNLLFCNPGKIYDEALVTFFAAKVSRSAYQPGGLNL